MGDKPGNARRDIDRGEVERAKARALAGIWEELREIRQYYVDRKIKTGEE